VNIKLDENLPARLTRFLGNLGHNVDTVPQEGLTGLDDATVWHAAQQSGRFLITQDLDFSDIRRYTPGSHHGLMLLRLRDPSRRALAHRIQTVFGMDEAQGWGRCFVVVTDRKIRVRRPPPPR
jgi:predicted nuclease of predicted toxin-antitoxin system